MRRRATREPTRLAHGQDISHDFPDLSNVLNPLLRDASANKEAIDNFAHFDDPAYNRRLDGAARLSGPARYIAYRFCLGSSSPSTVRSRFCGQAKGAAR